MNRPPAFESRGPSRERVQAIQFAGNFGAVEAFVGGDAGSALGGGYVVATRQGALRFAAEDWIVRQADGRYVAYPPHLFHDCYKPAPLAEEARS